MNLSRIRFLLHKMTEAMVAKDRRLLKTSEMQIEPHKKGVWKVSHMGRFVALLYKKKDGWEGQTLAGNTGLLGSKEEVLKSIAKLSPNAVVHVDGTPVR